MGIAAVLALYSIIVGGIGVLVNVATVVDSDKRHERSKAMWTLFFFTIQVVLAIATAIVVFPMCRATAG